MGPCRDGKWESQERDSVRTLPPFLPPPPSQGSQPQSQPGQPANEVAQQRKKGLAWWRQTAAPLTGQVWLNEGVSPSCFKEGPPRCCVREAAAPWSTQAWEGPTCKAAMRLGAPSLKAQENPAHLRASGKSHTLSPVKTGENRDSNTPLQTDTRIKQVKTVTQQTREHQG